MFLDRQAPHRPTNNPNASPFAQKAGGSDVCPRCGRTVYAAEKVIGGGNVRKFDAAISVLDLMNLHFDLTTGAFSLLIFQLSVYV